MLKHLNIDEMVALLAPFAKKTKRRRIFLAIPEIAPYLCKVVQAYQAVLAVRPARPAVPPVLSAIHEDLTRFDACHDHTARSVTLCLEAEREDCLAQDPPDIARAARCDEVNAKLFPNGLAIINASVLAESGNTARVAHLIHEQEPAIADFLKTIQAGPRGTLYDRVERWIAVGARLAKLERAREDFLATAPPATRSTVQTARGQWFRVVSQLLGGLELSNAPAADIEAIRGPVLRAADRAGRRHEGGASESVVPPADTSEAEETEEEDAPADDGGK